MHLAWNMESEIKRAVNSTAVIPSKAIKIEVFPDPLYI